MTETKGEYQAGQVEQFDLQAKLRALESGYIKLDQVVDSFNPFNPGSEYNRRRAVIDQIEKRILAEFTALRQRAEAAEAEVARLTRWIPVTERIPEDDGNCLTYGYWQEYFVAFCDCGQWSVQGVTHWMPLPKPPAPTPTVTPTPRAMPEQLERLQESDD